MVELGVWNPWGFQARTRHFGVRESTISRDMVRTGFFSAPARPSHRRGREHPANQRAHRCAEEPYQVAVACTAGAVERRHVTTVGYPKVAQYPPRLAALV
jgi:hypothetical protein